MTSSSDRYTFCKRCGCGDGNHLFGRCRGRDKKGSKWETCDFEWARCTIGGHSDITDAQYVDCARCWKHPAGNPEHFWGTQPDDKPKVPTADQLDIPYPEEPIEAALSSSVAGPSNPGHMRTFSNETASTDPLQWDTERIEDETSAVYQLTQDFNRAEIDDGDAAYPTISSEDSEYVETYYSKHRRHVCFCLADGREVRTGEAEWTAAWVDYEGTWIACLVYSDGTDQFYTWKHDAAEEGEKSKGKGKDKDKDKGKEKRKDKDKDKGKEKRKDKGKSHK